MLPLTFLECHGYSSKTTMSFGSGSDKCNYRWVKWVRATQYLSVPIVLVQRSRR